MVLYKNLLPAYNQHIASREAHSVLRRERKEAAGDDIDTFEIDNTISCFTTPIEYFIAQDLLNLCKYVNCGVEHMPFFTSAICLP
jgi:hypothetical protein